MLRKATSLSLCIIMVFTFVLSATAQAATVGGNYISSSGACVMDFETGDVLYEHNGNTPRVPASMTKIMNVYLIYEALEKGEISLDTVVPISQNVYNKSRNAVYQSVLPLYYDTKYTVDEMLDVIIVYSASGAAIAMAELLGGGSEAAFVEKMNAKVGEMGIDAYYYDSCGIANNEITPIGMATLARNIIKDYPDILTRTTKKSVSFHGNTYKTTNHLLDTYYYMGADGLKTGTTPASGYCFCGTAVRDGRRMISVTMNSSSTGQRFIDTARLLDYGFNVASTKYRWLHYTDISTFINGAEVPTFAYNGFESSAVVLAEDLANYGFDVEFTFDPETVIGTLTLTYNKDKAITPIPIDAYKNRNGENAYYVYNYNNRNVFVNNGAETKQLTNVLMLNGYMVISVDELGKLFDYTWNNETKSANITLIPKKSTPVPQSGGDPKEVKPILPNGEELTSGSAYIMDFETGDEIYSFDGDTQKAVASIAKMMSVYVILDAIKNGEIALDTVVPISENVYNLSRVEDYKMMVNLHYDETYTVDEMIDMIIIDSAAACVTAVAELISGSEKKFVKRMNEKAKEIGIGSVFYNGTGVCLNPETDKENLMSAKEVAIMARRMIEDYPDITERTKCASVNFHGQTYYNLNKMFTDYYYEGADGFKNGMTPASGYCMCGTAIRDGKRIITVTLPSNSNEARFTDTTKMFDYGFSVLGVDVLDAQIKNPNVPNVKDGDEITVNIDGNYVMEFPDQQPVVINNRVLIPIRALMETLEKKVEWDSENSQVIISDDTTTVKLSAGNDKMIKEVTNPLTGETTTEEVILDAAPVNINSRILLPIRAVVEAFGAAVIWEEETKTILIIAGVC